MKTTKYIPLVKILAAALVLFACGVPAPAATQPTASPTIPASPTDAPPPTEAAAPPPLTPTNDGPCPSPAAGQLAFTSAVNGYCLLHPDNYTANATFDPGTIILSGPSFGEGEPIVVYLSIESFPAGDNTTQSLADLNLSEMETDGLDFNRQNITLGGQPAIVAHGVPGILTSRQAFLVHNARAYILTLFPDAADDPAILTEADLLWDTVLASMVFIPAAASAGSGSDCTPDSLFLSDITIPDGSPVSPGQTFTKTWRMLNNGTCLWDSGYTLVQVNPTGSLLLADPLEVPLPQVAPGEEANISVQLTLSAQAVLGSEYRSQFQMRSPSGELFGSTPFVLVTAGDSPTSACPASSADLLAYVNQSEGYCLLHPSTAVATNPQPGTVYLNAPAGAQSELVIFLNIVNSGDVGGLTTQQFAQQQINASKAPGTNPATTTLTIGGHSAVVTEDLPGMMGTRAAFLVVNGRGYTFIIFPIDSSVPAESALAEQLWNIVVNSVVFLP